MTRELDQKIREALRREDDALLDELSGEPTVADLVMDNFRGTFRWLNLAGAVVGLAMMALGVLCAIRFFQVESTRELIAWASGFFFCMLAVFALKVWYWLDLSRHSLLREIKRVELQVARLVQRIESSQRD